MIYTTIVITNLFEFYILFSFFKQYLSTQRVYSNKTIVLLGLSFSIIYTYINLLRVPTVNTVTGLALFVIIAKIIFEDNTIKAISYSIIFGALSLSAEMVYTTLYILLTSTNMGIHLSMDASYVLNGLIGKCILYILFCILKKYFDYNSTDNSKDLLLLSSFSVLSLITMFIYDWLCSEIILSAWFNMTIFVFTVVMLLTSITIFFVYGKAMSKLELEARLKIKENILTLDSILFKQQQIYIDEMSALKHDYKNHIGNIIKLLSQSPDAALDYCNNFIELTDKIDSINTIDFNNIVLSTIYAATKEQCRRKNIVFGTDIRYKDFGFLSNLDTSTIFDNVFNNAIEANSTQENDTEKWISISTDQKNGHIIIVVKNSVATDVVVKDGQFLSCKRNFSEIGKGLANIQKTAEKYSGYSSCQFSESCFTTKIRLKGTEKKSET